MITLSQLNNLETRNLILNNKMEFILSNLSILVSRKLLLYHSVQGGCYGNKDEMKDCIREIEALEDTLCEMYATRIGKDKEEIRAIYFEDVYKRQLSCSVCNCLHHPFRFAGRRTLSFLQSPLRRTRVRSRLSRHNISRIFLSLIHILRRDVLRLLHDYNRQNEGSIRCQTPFSSRLWK